MSLQAALNIVYMKVVDDTYTDYLRDVNTILNLKQKLPQYNFELADGLTYDNNFFSLFNAYKHTYKLFLLPFLSYLFL